MKNIGKRLVILFMLITLVLSMTACGESSSERDLRSGFNKWSNGDYDSMNDSERRLVNDFLEWSND